MAGGHALVVGAGTGLGAALARAFAGDGMAVTVSARRQETVDRVVAEAVPAGVVDGAILDATDEAAVEALFDRLDAAGRLPDLVVYNASARVRESVLSLSAADFERSWRVSCLGGFLVGRAAARRLVARTGAGGAGGTILFTGATASVRGGALFAAFAAGKNGLRAVAQSMARELGPKGIHVGHVVVDGGIDRERTGDPARLDPDAIAAAYLMLHRQRPSAWTLELDIRPAVERF